MCNAISLPNRHIRVVDPEAALPVFLKDGSVRWVPWGVQHGELGNPLPKGAGARIKSLHEGRWSR